MNKNYKLSRAIKFAMLSGVYAVGAGVFSTAQAQQAEEQIEEITVTGSRIVRRDFEGTSPVFTLDSSSIQDAGTPQIEQVLNELPQLVPTITTTSNNPSNGGQAQVDLRGLGSSRTLVLMDGIRLQPSNVSGIIDLNTVPSGLIESVEIVTGGGSAVYGSDAIAGVVNIKLRQDFEGVQVQSTYAQTGESDGTTQTISLTMGGNFDGGRGNAVMYMSYDDREAVFAGDREFSAVALGPSLNPLGSVAIPDGFFVPAGANAPSQAAYNSVFGAGRVPNTDYIGFNTDGTLFSRTGTVNYKGDTSDPGFNPASYSYNYSPVNYLQLPLERRQVAAFGHYELADNVEAYAKMSYTTYNAAQELAATPITSGVGSTMPVTNPFIPQDLRTILASRPNPTAPFTLFKRTTEVGGRNGDNNYDVLQMIYGTRGDFQLSDYTWNWDIWGSWGRTQRTEIQTGNVSRSALNRAYNATAANPDPLGCGGLNPFGLGQISDACAAAIAVQAQNTTVLTNTMAGATMTGGVFELPAGTFQVALGVEYRENVADFKPDQFLASGDVVGFNAQQPTTGAIDVKEFFVEFDAPLLSGAPMANYLGLNGAARHSDYNLAGGVDTYSLGLDYEPIDQLKLRGSYNKAIAAPNVSQLFRPQNEGFPSYTDPCWNGSAERTGPNASQVNALCAAQGAPANFPQGNSQVRALTGGNPDLAPEEADTYTLGSVWTPDIQDVNLRVAVDWFRYEITERIGSVGASSIVSRCFNAQDSNPTFSPSNQWCSFFERSTSGVAENVRATDQNLGKMNIDGIDLQVDGAMQFGPGEITANLAWTHLLKWQQQEDPSAPLTDQEGTIGIIVAETLPENKARLSTGYALGDYSVQWTMNFIEGMDVVNSDAPRSPVANGIVPTVGSYTYHRLTGTWNPSNVEGLSLTAGINNLFDKAPPIYTSDSRAGIQANTDPSVYDVLGRRYFVTASYRF
ncbi:TonB-dependent receptor [Pseudohongiella sp. SYSU M77423]|uniref:TonB-dependent receptor domain-containing protein n=1 Tax=unclassified Pseudohongiella TaxID=2629611 RepID=UPI001F34B304|nr:MULTISPECIES: TonB-dependent receptor [unclassified Pseudohongiella]MDH7942642.1 TonB-dependent receptor [Pseudohongiella sp. SYSU M77423]